jgi:hypothetical protein
VLGPLHFNKIDVLCVIACSEVCEICRLWSVFLQLVKHLQKKVVYLYIYKKCVSVGKH